MRLSSSGQTTSFVDYLPCPSVQTRFFLGFVFNFCVFYNRMYFGP